MNLDEKLRQLKQAATKSTLDLALERQLAHLRHVETRTRRGAPLLPAQRAPKGIEEYVKGQLETNSRGEFFLARQALPFGRPYGKLRISDVSAADLSPLNIFLHDTAVPEPSRMAYLDTETTGLAGGTGTCAFLIGIGSIQGPEFEVKQFFLRDYPDEKAALAAVVEALAPYAGVVTFNGKSFDIPLLETRYALARMKSPFARLLHLDLLHPARRLWKLRLERCKLTDLEKDVLGIRREGDVDGSDIPGIYFDYLRTGNARGLQPIFYHNALDIVTLAALAAELARIIGEAGSATGIASLDLFSLSRILERAGSLERSVRTCQQALAAGLPESAESRALWHLAAQHKRRRQPERAAEIWIELTRRELDVAIAAFEQLAIYYEHRRRDAATALVFTEAAIEKLQETGELRSSSRGDRRQIDADPARERFTHRLARLQRKAAQKTGVLV